jgi:hypothetical protein
MSATNDPADNPQDEESEFREAASRFSAALKDIDTNVQGLIKENRPLWDGLAQLLSRPGEEIETGKPDNRQAEIKTATDKALITLAEPRSRLEAAAEDFLHYVYELASRRKNPAIFYGERSNSLASAETLGDGNTLVGRNTRRVKEQKALDDIRQVAISSGDTVKEINRLLDLTSTKRMAEEMDIVTYQSNASRQFDRIQTEFNQAVASFKADQDDVGLMSEAVGDFKLKKDGWIKAMLPGVAAENKAVEPLLEAVSANLIITADTFLRRYKNFLVYAQSYASSVGGEFYTEASVEAYKDGTRVHAERIAKEGLFASLWTILVGLVAGLAVASTLILYDNNLALKNWLVPAACIAAVLAYLFSVRFGQIARDRIMNDLRQTLYDSVSDSPVVLSPAAPKATATGKLWTWLKTWSFDRWLGTRVLETCTALWGYLDFSHGDSDEFFRFSKIKWEDLDKGVTNSDRTKDSLALKIYDVNKFKWPMNQSRTFLKNAGMLLAILAIPLIFSYYSDTFGRDRQFAFISRTNELGSCVLERGRILLATGGSYFVETRDGNPVTEITKSLVMRIEPSETATTTNPGPKPDLPNCATPRPEPKAPDQMALVTATDRLGGSIKDGLNTVASRIGGGQDDPTPLANLAAATKDLADNVKTGLGTVAAKLGGSTPNPVSLADLTAATDKLASNVKNGLDAVAGRIPASPDSAGTQASSAPVVVPVIINAPSAPASAPQTQAGPTFITQVYTADGKVYDYGSGTMMLPIFLDPVAGSHDPSFDKAGINTPEKAYFFGLTSLTNENLPNSKAKRALVHEIGARYTECMERTRIANEKAGNTGAAPRLKLSIEGYASEKWDGVEENATKQTFNLFLAEGRRAAIIQALGIDHPLIDIDKKPPPVTFGSWQDVHAGQISPTFVFEDYRAMKTSLEKRLPPLPGDEPSTEEKAQQESILAHAAVISVDGETPPLCRPGAG